MGRVPKTSRKEVSPTKRARIVDRYQLGYSIPSIYKSFDLPRSTVRSIIDRYKDEEDTNFRSKPRLGAKPALSPRGERRLLRHAATHTKDTLFALCSPSKSGKQLGRCTVRKTLKKYGMAKRRPRKKPWLRKDNKPKRLVFCRGWKTDKRDPNTVCWSDEATFYVGEDNNVCYVTRRAGEEYEDRNLTPTFKSGRTAVGVWSCFCGDQMGPLVIIPKGGTMTAKRYIGVLRKHFIPFYNKMKRKYGCKVVMQEDNATWHKAQSVRDFLRRQKVKILSWPPQSPDLSPIENLWKFIKGIIGKMRYRIKNISQMEEALAEVWPTIKGETLLKLNRSMWSRINAVIKNKGGHTKY
jgi:transposase